MLPMPGSAAPAAHASGPWSACAHFASKKLSALVATTARLMRKAKRRAPADSMKLYVMASLSARGEARLTSRERTRPEWR